MRQVEIYDDLEERFAKAQVKSKAHFHRRSNAHIFCVPSPLKHGHIGGLGTMAKVRKGQLNLREPHRAPLHEPDSFKGVLTF